MVQKIKSKLLTPESMYFFIGGVSAFLVDLGLLSFMVYLLNFHPIVFDIVSVPNVISTTVALIYNFIFQKFLAFDAGKSKKIKSEISKFILVQIFTVVVFGGIIFGLLLSIGLSILLSKLITTLLQMISSYVLYKYFVFKK